mmetsp:Transcript_13353/g.26142  ORF Transcript_13353/g.26142 Transcript_13353/m.26142 type:complete len:242 (+) Transcript_13353:574-1299(+)
MWGPSPSEASTTWWTSIVWPHVVAFHSQVSFRREITWSIRRFWLNCHISLRRIVHTSHRTILLFGVRNFLLHPVRVPSFTFGVHAVVHTVRVHTLRVHTVAAIQIGPPWPIWAVVWSSRAWAIHIKSSRATWTSGAPRTEASPLDARPPRTRSLTGKFRWKSGFSAVSANCLNLRLIDGAHLSELHLFYTVFFPRLLVESVVKVIGNVSSGETPRLVRLVYVDIIHRIVWFGKLRGWWSWV